MKKDLIKTIKIITLGLIFSTGIALASVATDFVFTKPAANAPGYVDPAGVAAPINSGISNQVKKGAMATGPLTVFGNSEFHGVQSILSSNNLYVSGNMGIGQGGTGTYVGAWFGPGPTYPGVLVPYDGGENPTRSLEIVNENNPSVPTSAFTKSYMKVTTLNHTLAFTTPYSGSSKLREVCSDTTGMLVKCDIHALTPIPPVCPANYDPTKPCTISWTIPGSYSFILPYGTNNITIKVWGGGAGGQGGVSSHMGSDNWGPGGFGGGNGSYTTATFAIPHSNPTINYSDTLLTVVVGSGGPGGPGGGYMNNVDTFVPGGTGGNGAPSSVKVVNSTIITAAGGTAPSTAQNANPISGVVGVASPSGGAGGAGGTDPGCVNSSNSFGNQGNPGGTGGAPGGGGGGGSGARSCGLFSGDHTGGSGGSGSSGKVTISWN